MKQAIEYNLAGSARNDANEVVHFTLQGDKDEIEQFTVVHHRHAAAIHHRLHNQEGELLAVIELRRPFPGVTHNAMARACAPSIAR